MSSQVEIGIVAAMEREIAPLIAGWHRESVAGAAGKQHRFYRNAAAVATCSGPTKMSAAASTKVLVERFAPRVLVSVGFAGSLHADVRVPELVAPKQVVDDGTGRRYETLGGKGTLVTVDQVVGSAAKSALASRWSAVAVDMEAAAVAEFAQRHGIGFAAVKVISDESSAEIDFIGKFVTPDGFRTGAFLRHVALRPSLWPVVKGLQANAGRATEVLCEALKGIVEHPEGIRSALLALTAEHAETRT